MRNLQSRWPELEKSTAAIAGDIVAQALSSNGYSDFEILVPAGSSLGVDIEGLEVVTVTDRSFGWAVGDKIQEINGVEVTDKDKAVKAVKQARDANQPIKVLARRLARSPFVTLERSLRAVYQESDSPLPEFDDVMKKVASLRAYAPMIGEGFKALGDVKPSLDSLVSDLDKYAAEEQQAGKAKPPPKPSSSGGGGGGSGDLDGLFG